MVGSHSTMSPLLSSTGFDLNLYLAILSAKLVKIMDIAEVCVAR